jgi:hypothetical protein
MATRTAQRGLTLTGFIVMTALVMVIGLVGFRMVPAYIEYYSVKKAVEGALAESATLSPSEIRKWFDRRIAADYIDSIRTSDLEVTKDGNQVVATVVWQRRLPLVANVNLLLDFEASARR